MDAQARGLESDVDDATQAKMNRQRRETEIRLAFAQPKAMDPAQKKALTDELDRIHADKQAAEDRGSGVMPLLRNAYFKALGSHIPVVGKLIALEGVIENGYRAVLNFGKGNTKGAVNEVEQMAIRGVGAGINLKYGSDHGVLGAAGGAAVQIVTEKIADKVAESNPNVTSNSQTGAPPKVQEAYKRFMKIEVDPDEVPAPRAHDAPRPR
jgi:hypothetical protein